MDLLLTGDQLELQEVARAALATHAPLSLARAFLDDDPSAVPLHALLDELGWHSVGLDDDGFGLGGLVLLAHAVGAHAAPTALVDAAVAARLAARMVAAGSADPLVARVAAGTQPAALAVLDVDGDWSLVGGERAADTACAARAAGGDFILHGTKVGVQHGATLGALAVVADCDGEPAVALISTAADGLAVAPSRGLDPACAPATVALREVRVPAGALLTAGDAAAALAAGFAVGALATTAEAIGAASAALDLAIDYAREREQFGRPIGSFQALAHLIADAHVARESAWSSVLYAAAALEEERPDCRTAVAIARAYGCRASRSVVETALQVLGGVAFTWEHDVHLLQRRVLSCERRFGDALAHEETVAGECFAFAGGFGLAAEPGAAGVRA